MAVTEANTKSSLHTRSNSLPSAPHPLISQHEEHLQKLRDSEATSSISSSSLSHKLNGLLDLQDCTDKLLQLPMKQQAVAQKFSDKCVDDILEGSLRLLDICSTAKECLQISKETLSSEGKYLNWNSYGGFEDKGHSYKIAETLPTIAGICGCFS
ncbi:hypothetical protein D0Y65_008436 [Glycine soja]|uniref:Uncharacterized protein n=1 Tax=Glycine soja TaxID=3848 RepID=A0A445KUS6_GLYSO|nr:hypothetical protein D0Y65_008436 [Glycine soja]